MNEMSDAIELKRIYARAEIQRERDTFKAYTYGIPLDGMDALSKHMSTRFRQLILSFGQEQRNIVKHQVAFQISLRQIQEQHFYFPLVPRYATSYLGDIAFVLSELFFDEDMDANKDEIILLGHFIQDEARRIRSEHVVDCIVRCVVPFIFFVTMMLFPYQDVASNLLSQMFVLGAIIIMVGSVTQWIPIGLLERVWSIWRYMAVDPSLFDVMVIGGFLADIIRVGAFDGRLSLNLPLIWCMWTPRKKIVMCIRSFVLNGWFPTCGGVCMGSGIGISSGFILMFLAHIVTFIFGLCLFMVMDIYMSAMNHCK